MNTETKYICTGGCGGSVTEEEYNAGKTTCGDPDCPKYGQPFEKRQVCAGCEQTIEDGENHSH